VETLAANPSIQRQSCDLTLICSARSHHNLYYSDAAMQTLDTVLNAGADDSIIISTNIPGDSHNEKRSSPLRRKRSDLSCGICKRLFRKPEHLKVTETVGSSVG